MEVCCQSYILDKLFQIASFNSKLFPQTLFNLTSWLVSRDMGFDRVRACLVCQTCQYVINLKDGENSEKIIQQVLGHRLKCHGHHKVEAINGQNGYPLLDKEPSEAERTKSGSNSYEALADHLTIKGVTVDARMVKARLDYTDSIFLLSKGIRRPSIKLAIAIQLATRGDDFPTISEFVDLVLKLEEHDTEKLMLDFDKIIKLPQPSLKKVVVVSSPSSPTTTTGASCGPSASGHNNLARKKESGSTKSKLNKMSFLPRILKNIPGLFTCDRQSTKKEKQVKGQRSGDRKVSKGEDVPDGEACDEFDGDMTVDTLKTRTTSRDSGVCSSGDQQKSESVETLPPPLLS